MTMKTVLRQLILLLVGCLPNIAFSAEKMDLATDSIASDTLASSVVLEDVVVKSDMVVNIKNGIAYYPTEAVKKIAYEIIDVMRMLPLTTAYIKDDVLYSNGTNEAAVYFIDGVQAIGQDLKMLLPRDIKRVEVLQNPSEAKFMSKSFVVNITTKKVILGGYGKINGSNSLVAKVGNYDIAAKAVAHKSEFIVNGDFSYEDKDNGESRETISYDFPVSSATSVNNEPTEEEGLRYKLNRESFVSDASSRQYNSGLAFQWRYTRDEATRYYLSGGYSMWDQPGRQSRGWNHTSLMLPGAALPIDSVTEFSKESNWRMIASSLSFNYNHEFSNGVLIDASAFIGYTHRNQFESYRANMEKENTNDIVNKASQNSWAPNLSLYIHIPLKKSRSMFAELSASEVFYDVNRSGTANISTNQRKSNYSLLAGYRQDIYIKKEFFSYVAALNLPINRFKYTDSFTETTLMYSATFNFHFSHGQLFTIDGRFNARQLNLPSFYHSGISIQETDISGQIDNLDFDAPRQYNGSLNISFKLNKKFFVGGYVSHSYEPNAVVEQYLLKDNVVYSYMVNGGKWNETDMRLTASLRLLDNNLGFDIKAGFAHSDRSDFPNNDLWAPRGNISAFYASNKGWGVNAEYYLPWHKANVRNSRMVSIDREDAFRASLYYNNKNLSIKLSGYKIFDRNVKSESSLNSNNVNIYSSSVFPNNSQVRISISYLLDFGRRYAHDAEGISPVRPNAL